MRSMRRVAAAGTVCQNSECRDLQDQGSHWNGLESLEGRLLLDGGPTVNITAPYGYQFTNRGDQITFTYSATLDGPTAHVDFYSRIGPDFPTGPDFSVGSHLIGSQDLSATGSNTFVWDTSSVQPGLYFVEAVVTDGTNTNPAPFSGAIALTYPVANPIVTFDTSMGQFQIELDQNAAPITVANFRDLVQSGFYNGLIFHRVISGFMDQAGGFDASMTKKLTGFSSPNNAFADIGLSGIYNENQATDTLSNVRGTIAMARTSAPNSATSEFFVNDADNSGFLDKGTSQDGVGYCVFGHVISGMDVIDAINAVPTQGWPVGADSPTYTDVPVTPIVINNVTIQDAVNTAPSFTTRPSATVWSGAGAMTIAQWVTSTSQGADSEYNQRLTFQVTNVDHPELFDVAPTIDAQGALSFTPKDDVAGVATITVVARDNGGTENGGQDTSAPQTFTITTSFSSPENTAPVAQPITDSTLEGQGIAITLSGSDAETAADSIIYKLGTAPLHGQVDIQGNVAYYTPDAGYAGPDSFTYIATDDGIPYGSNFNPADSEPASVSIAIAPVNNAPSFTPGANQNILEDDGPQTVPGWAADINPGGADETGQTLTFVISDIVNPGLFSVAPSIAADGTLTYTVAPNANGGATITYYLQDDGGTANGGNDTSASQTFTIHVQPVNDAPSFLVGAHQTVGQDSGPQSVPSWATAISPGPANESVQLVGFAITDNTNPGLFAVAPDIAADGTLTFQPALNAFGSATISLVLHDNGGVASGGVDASSAQSFTITVNPVNHTPTAISQSVTVGDDAGVTITLSGGDLETAPAGLVYAVVTGPVHGTLTRLGNDTFRYEVGRSYAGMDIITFTVSDSGGPAGSNLVSQSSAPAAVYITGGTMRDFDATNKLAFTGTTGAGLMTLKNGTGSAFFAHSGVCDIGRIFLSGTGDKSTLTVASKTKSHVILLGGIDSSATMSSILAPTMDISGPISIGKGSGVTLSFGKATSASIDTKSPIRSLTAASWLRSDDSAAMIQTPTLTKLTVAGDFAGDLEVDTFGGGRIGGAMTGDTVSVKGNVGRLTIVGALASSTWDVLGSTDVMSIGGDLASTKWSVKGNIGNVIVTGTADHSSLRSGGNMAAITVGASKGSDFLAGIDKNVTRTPFGSTQFSVGATIKSFTVKGLKKQALGATDFADTNLAAWNLGTINLLNGDFSTAAIRGASGGKITLVKHTDKTNKANNWTYKPGGPLGAQPTGFIRLL